MTKKAMAEPKCGIIDFSEYDEETVDSFYDAYLKSTFHVSTAKRSKKLDKRLEEANLSLADKIELLKRLSPPHSPTGGSKEIRMERLILSVDPGDLSKLKYAIDYDGDYKDMVEYVFHDIDEERRQKAIVDHFAGETNIRGVKVLSDVDDTMYANLVDPRYPKKTLYPGVLAFYKAMGREPFEHEGIPLTTLSARPGMAGVAEESSIRGLMEKTKHKLCPTALSGEAISSLIGTVETVARVNTPVKDCDFGHAGEDEIGEVKFANFAAYSLVYPDYRFVFIGDSGQGDPLTAEKMASDTMVEGAGRVLTTFIHDLSGGQTDARLNSPSFRRLDSRLKVTADSENPKGVVIFRNYIAAAVVAYAHADKLYHLITAEDLGMIVSEALVEFKDIPFDNEEGDRERLLHEYREDAQTAVELLRNKNEPGVGSLVQEIEDALARLNE